MKTRDGSAWVLLIILCTTGALFVTTALHKGMMIDEFHSLFHASSPDGRTFFENLRKDNHPPLSFAAIKGARALWGEAQVVLRLPAMLYGLLSIVWLWRLARRLPGRWTALIAAGLLASSSLHVEHATQARMYLLLTLAVTGLLEEVLVFLETPAERSLKSSSILLVLWTVVGLHTHYFFLHYMLLIGAGFLVALWLTPQSRHCARRMLLPALAAIAFCAPWYLWGFREQLTHGLPRGGRHSGLAALAEAYIHLFYINLRFGGPLWRIVFIAGGMLATVLGMVGSLRLASANRGGPRRAYPILLSAIAFGVPIWVSVVAWLQESGGFTWQYLLPSAPAMAVLIAACVGSGRLRVVRHLSVAAVLSSALVLTCFNVASKGTNDYPGAIRWIADSAGRGDALIVVEYQPPVFTQGRPWEHYAPRVAPIQAAILPRLAVNRHYNLSDPDELKQYSRVFLMRSALPDGANLMGLLRARYSVEEAENFGFGLWVHRFEEPRD